MSEALYSRQEYAQWRGPTTSDKYNERIENLYKDLMTLVNRLGITDEELRLLRQRIFKDELSLAKVLDDLVSRIAALEAGDTILTFGDPDQIDVDRFSTTDFSVSTDAECSWDGQYSIITLPKNASSSFSKLKMQNADGTYVIPSTFEALAQGVTNTADSVAARLSTSDVYNAVLQQVGTVWERNVVVDAPDVNGAEVILHVRFPTDMVVNENTNCIIIHPFPIMGCDILDVEYTTNFDVALNSTDSYVPLNSTAMYDGNTRAIGWVPPGGWTGDEINNAGPKIFYFDPTAVTGIKIKLRQRTYMLEDNKYVYSYGLSKLDARYEKFADSGRTIIRFDAPDGQTISDVTNVTPEIWNVLEGELPNVFSYRVIWEVAEDIGIYTTTAVPNSKKVWVEVTLSKTDGGATPVLSGLNIEYTN